MNFHDYAVSETTSKLNSLMEVVEGLGSNVAAQMLYDFSMRSHSIYSASLAMLRSGHIPRDAYGNFDGSLDLLFEITISTARWYMGVPLRVKVVPKPQPPELFLSALAVGGTGYLSSRKQA